MFSGSYGTFKQAGKNFLFDRNIEITIGKPDGEGFIFIAFFSNLLQ